jgi:SAM-dependent methyltransferase
MAGEYEGVQARYYDEYFSGVPGDVEFYLEVAAKSGREGVLELGSGTGRILLPLAAAGIPVVGLERSEEMLQLARRNLKAVQAEFHQRVELVQGDMREFSLGRMFPLIIAPYRTFQHLLNPADQRAALRCIREHLEPGGIFVFNVFDPLQDLAARAWSDDTELRKDLDFDDPETGELIEVWYRRGYDLVQQLLQQELVFRRPAKSGGEISSVPSRLVLRYAGRFEMEHLLAGCDLRVKHLYGGFRGEPYPGYGEQVWIVERPLNA